MSNKNNSLLRGAAALVAIGTLLPVLVASSGRADTITFGKASKLGGGSEPEIVLGADGSVFVDAPTGTPGHSALWRQGASASKFDSLAFTAPYNRLPGGGDSAVALTPNGSGGNRVYFLDLWLGSDSLTVSQDNGATWTSGSPFTSLPPSDRQWIAAGSRDPGTGNDTLYMEYHLVPTGVLMFGKSTDNGATWVPSYIGTTIPSEGSTANPLVADGNFVATNYVSGNQMFIATSNDAGATWTVSKASYLKNLATTSIENMALDGQNLWLAYVDNSYQIQVIHSPDRGATWEHPAAGLAVPAQVSESGSNVYPWIAARNGKVAVSWYGNATGSGTPEGASGQWDLMYSELTGHDEYGNMTFSTPVVAAPRVKVGPICLKGVECTADRELGDFQSIAIDAAGKANIAFISGTQVQVVKQN
jgi:hypothetical protein